MGYFILFFDFGFNFSATKKIAQHRSDPVFIEKTISVVYTAKIFLVLAGFLPLLVLILCVGLLHQYVLLTVLYYLSTAAQIFIPDFLYRGLEKMEGVTYRYILAKLITAVLIFLIVRDDSGLILVPLSYLIGTVAAALHTNHHMVKKLGYHISLCGFREAIAELRESWIYFISTFASTALSVTSTFVMGLVGMPTDQIAYWGVAFQVVQAVQSMYDPITSSIYPHVAEKKDHKFVLRVTLCLLPLVAVGCVLLYFLAGTAVELIAGSKYLAAVPVLQALTPMLLFSFVAQMLGFPFLGALGWERQTSLSTLVAAGAQVLGLVVLALSHHFTLLSLALLRNITELIFMLLRICFVCAFLREYKKKFFAKTN